MTYPNFVIDEITGMIYLIDFGDSFTWYGGWYETRNYNLRNLQNLFTIWARGYDEEKYLEDFIDVTVPEITGDRQWRPPAHTWTSLNQNKIGSLFIAKELLK
jgi:hypothetical protein